MVDELAPPDPELRDRVVLVTHELASNVEAHAPGWLTVDLVPAGDGVVVAVSDPRPVSLPRRTHPTRLDDRRGIPEALGPLVAEGVADGWGLLVRPTSETVWACVATVASAPAIRGPGRQHRGGGHGRRVPHRRRR